MLKQHPSMAAKQPASDPELVAFERLLRSEKPGPERDLKLLNQYCVVLNEKNILQERLSIESKVRKRDNDES